MAPREQVICGRRVDLGSGASHDLLERISAGAAAGCVVVLRAPVGFEGYSTARKKVQHPLFRAQRSAVRVSEPDEPASWASTWGVGCLPVDLVDCIESFRSLPPCIVVVVFACGLPPSPPRRLS